MGGFFDKVNIKNTGAVIAFATLLWGAWYILIRFRLVTLDGNLEILLSVIGVFVITYLAYMPYGVLYHIVDRSNHKSFLLGFTSIFFVGDIFIRSLLFLDQIGESGFLVAVLYPFFMTGCIYTAFKIVYMVRCFVIQKHMIIHFYLSTKKTVAGLFHKRML